MTSLRSATTRTAPVIGAALRPFRTPIRGHAFAARPAGSAPPHAGIAAHLRREPANPADDLAVGIWIDTGSGPWRAGYLDRAVAAWLAPELDRGLAVEARLDGWVAEPEGRWRRPVVVVLPGVSAEPASDPASEAPTTASARRRPADRGRRSLWGRPPGVTVRPVRTPDRS